MLASIIDKSGTINICVDGKIGVVTPDRIIYNDIRNALNQGDEEEIKRLLDWHDDVAEKTKGRVSYYGGVVRYNGSAVDNAISRAITELDRKGFNYDSILLFLENCYANPDPTIVERIWDFLTNNCICISSDGYIVGYKAIRENYRDKRTNTFDYSVGKVVTMPRENCDSNSSNGCSSGLHSGSLSYALGFAEGDDRIIITRTNPADVTAVPEEHGFGKLRCCKLEVIGEWKGKREPEYMYDYANKMSNRDSKGRFLKGAQIYNVRDKNGRFKKS